jgi:phosphate transport system protein
MQHFEQELDRLKQNLLAMAGQAERAVNLAMRALVEREDDLARTVKEDDDQLDRFEKAIDEQAIKLLSMAPLATDLRLIAVTMKISQNLERVGDEATQIANRSLDLSQEPPLKPYVDLPRMARLALEMLKEALNAFVQGQAELALAVIPRDQQVDQLNRQLHRELASYMVEQPSTISRCLHLMVISKSLERIADHAKNIAEQVVYLREAKDIRHPKLAAAGPSAPAPSA